MTQPVGLEPVGEVQHMHELNDPWLAKLLIGTKLYSEAQLRQVQAERDEVREQLRFANINTEVWMRDAKGKLEDRTAAYKEVDALQAQVTLLREALRQIKQVVLENSEAFELSCEALAATEPKEQKT